MKKYSTEIKSAALILAGLAFLGCITAFVYSQVSDFWGDGAKEDTPSGLEFLEKHKDQFVKTKKLIDVADVNTGTNADISAVHFADKNLGLICGEEGTALLTTDGGLTWRTMQGLDPAANFTDCYISIDKKIFIIEESENLYVSYDLGQSWQVTKLEEPFSPLRIKFYEGGYAFITGSNGVILRSSDYGNTWNKTVSQAKSIIYDLDFRDKKNGMAVGTDGVFLVTSDGGNNWLLKKKFSKDYLKRIKYINGSNWITVGAEGSVFLSSSNGESWAKAELGDNEGFRSILILNEEDMILGDSKGSLFITKDAGDSWKRLADIDEMKLSGLASISKNELIAVGDNGKIKRIIIK
jgi:photosystem II stability/assembly factor-like uncharacterized protein